MKGFHLRFAFFPILLILSLLSPRFLQAEGTITIRWLGHSAFQITSEDGVRVFTDPFAIEGRDAVGYARPPVEADLVTISHEHRDHNQAGWIQGSPKIFRGLTSNGQDWQKIDHRLKDVRITTVPVYHDKEQGRLRGKNNVFVIEASGLRIAHFSDMGHIPDEATYQALGRVDILLIPVGGFFSIDGDEAAEIVSRLKPPLVIPQHFKTEAIADWPISDETEFLAHYKDAKRLGRSQVEVSPASLPKETEVWVLTYQ